MCIYICIYTYIYIYIYSCSFLFLEGSVCGGGGAFCSLSHRENFDFLFGFLTWSFMKSLNFASLVVGEQSLWAS